MIKIFRQTASVLIVILALYFVAFQYGPPSEKPPLQPTAERWVPSLARVKSIDDATPIAWSYIQKEKGTKDEKIVRGVDAFVRDRFLHGISHTSAQENWILAALGGGPPYGFNVPIGANSILQHRQAMCSQQSIVFMELLKRFGIEYASVRFAWPHPEPSSRGHFAVAAKVDGNWRYFDSNMEASNSPLIRDILNGQGVSQAYPGDPWWVNKMKYAAKHGGIRITDENRLPGHRGLLFQNATRILSSTTPFLMMVLALLCWPGFIVGLRRSIAVRNRFGVGIGPHPAE